MRVVEQLTDLLLHSAAWMEQRGAQDSWSPPGFSSALLLPPPPPHHHPDTHTHTHTHTHTLSLSLLTLAFQRALILTWWGCRSEISCPRIILNLSVLDFMCPDFGDTAVRPSHIYLEYNAQYVCDTIQQQHVTNDDLKLWLLEKASCTLSHSSMTTPSGYVTQQCGWRSSVELQTHVEESATLHTHVPQNPITHTWTSDPLYWLRTLQNMSAVGCCWPTKNIIMGNNSYINQSACSQQK